MGCLVLAQLQGSQFCGIIRWFWGDDRQTKSVECELEGERDGWGREEGGVVWCRGRRCSNSTKTRTSSEHMVLVLFFAPFYRTTRICMIYMLPFVLSTAIALTWSAAQLDRMHFSIHRSSWRIPPSHFTEGIGLGVQRDLPFLEGTYIAYQRAQHCEH